MLRLELCNLKKLSKKNGGGDVYIAQVLCICEGKTAILDNFIDEKTYYSLLEIYKENINDNKITVIDNDCIIFDIYNNHLICKVDFSLYI